MFQIFRAAGFCSFVFLALPLSSLSNPRHLVIFFTETLEFIIPCIEMIGHKFQEQNVQFINQKRKKKRRLISLSG